MPSPSKINMAAESQSWHVEMTTVDSDSIMAPQPADKLPMDESHSAEEEKIHKDFKTFLKRIFTTSQGSKDALEEFTVHKGVNLGVVLSRLQSLIPSGNKKSLPIDVYNHISILSQNIEAYLHVLESNQVDDAANRIHEDTVKWITSMFGLDEVFSIFHNHALEGLLKVCRLALHSKYSKYATDGFTALYTRPPVIYVSAATPPEFGKKLRHELGLPQSSICTVPCNTMFGSPFTMDVAAFERLLTDDVSCGKTPLMLIAYAGTPVSGHTDNLSRLREICTQSGVWLHVEGDTLANLALSHVQPSVQVAVNADSVTFNFSKWFGIACLPYCTFYRIKNTATIMSAGLESSSLDKLLALPMWVIVQFMGTHDLKRIIEHASGLSQQMCNRLDMINGMKRIEQPTGISPTVIFKYKASPTLPLSLNQGDESTKQKKAAPRGKIEISSKLAEALNTLVMDHLRETVPKVVIDSVHIAREGLCLKFNPLETSRNYNTSKNDVDDYVEKLQAIIAHMDYTLVNRSAFQETFQRIPDVALVDITEEPALGGFQCVPKYWKTKTMTNLSDLKKHELNELNKNVSSALCRHYDSVQEKVLPNGQICIQVGVVSDSFNLQQFSEAVLKLTIDMEDNAKFVESLKDSVQQSIEEAEAKLKKEQEEKFFQDGVLRSVPLVSSLYNWWSPPPKENHGVTGKSFDLSSGKLESTDKTYKLKMQIHEDQFDRLSQMSSKSNSTQPPADPQNESESSNSDGDLSEVESEENEQNTSELTEKPTEVKESELTEKATEMKESDV